MKTTRNPQDAMFTAWPDEAADWAKKARNASGREFSVYVRASAAEGRYFAGIIEDGDMTYLADLPSEEQPKPIFKNKAAAEEIAEIIIAYCPEMAAVPMTIVKGGVMIERCDLNSLSDEQFKRVDAALIAIKAAGHLNITATAVALRFGLVGEIRQGS